MKRRNGSLLLTMTVLAAVAAASREEPVLQRGAVGLRTVPPRAAASDAETTPLSGRLFYEDHRRASRPNRKKDVFGQPGARKPSRSTPAQRFLGAERMVVDVYERDPLRSLAPGCVPLAWVGQAVVQPDGGFAVDVPAADDCPRDGPPRYALRVQTRYCDDTLCFSVGLRRGQPYTLWFDVDAPQPGAGYPVGDLLFSPSRRPDKNDWSRAANHYASLVDVIVGLHVDNGIPFRQEAFGELFVRFPSLTSSGFAASPARIEANNSGWPKGGLMVHEYGHIVHRRAWGGDYAGYLNPIQPWSGAASSAEEPFIAFKEGWANFIGRYLSGRCERPRYDTNYALPSLARGLPGNRFPENHHRALCDWVDGTDDRRPGVTGAGDVFSESFASLWATLDLTDDAQARYDSHDPINEGLDFCDVATTFVMVQKSAEQVGEDAHRRARWEVSCLLENNDLSCASIPEPAALLEHDLALTVHSAPPPDKEPHTVVRQELVVANTHPFMASPPVALEVAVDGGAALLGVTVPALPVGDHARYRIAVAPAGDLSLSARILDETGRDLAPENDAVRWVVPRPAP